MSDEEIQARVARSNRSVLAGMQHRLQAAEEQLRAKQASADTHPSALKRARLYVQQLQNAELKLRGMVDRGSSARPDR